MADDGSRRRLSLLQNNPVPSYPNDATAAVPSGGLLCLPHGHRPLPYFPIGSRVVSREGRIGREIEALTSDSQVVRAAGAPVWRAEVSGTLWDTIRFHLKNVVTTTTCKNVWITNACDLCNTSLKTAGVGPIRGVPLLRGAVG